MNRLNLQSAVLGLGLLLAGSAAQAQENGVKADIPFNFVVGNQNLPAGEYTITSPGDLGQAIVIRSDSSKATALTVTSSCSSSQPSDKTKLIFRQVGGLYFLSQIWTQGNSSGRELRKSPVETQLAKNDNAPKQLVVAARLAR